MQNNRKLEEATPPPLKGAAISIASEMAPPAMRTILYARAIRPHKLATQDCEPRPWS